MAAPPDFHRRSREGRRKRQSCPSSSASQKCSKSIVASDGWEILFVDDGSTDATLAAIAAAHLRDPRVRALSLSRNFGKEAALSAGLDHARGQAVVPMDVDMQDPPEVLRRDGRQVARRL